MSGHYVEAGDGFDWVEDPAPYVPKAEGASIAIPGLEISAPSSIPVNLSSNPAYLNMMASSGETGQSEQEIQGLLAPQTKDLGNGMSAQYSPVTGELTGFTSAERTGGSYDVNGNFHPYQNEGWSLGSFLGGALSGVEDIATSGAVKAIAPMVVSAGLGGGAGIGNLLGVGPIAGGAIAGGGTAALTGGDVLKGAVMGGLSGAGSAPIGDTGVSLGQINAGVNVAKSLENGNLLGAVTGAANLAGAGNTQIGDTGFTLNEIAKDLNLAKAVISGNPQAVFNAVTAVAGPAIKAANANATNTPTEDQVNQDVAQQLAEAGLTNAGTSGSPEITATQDVVSNLPPTEETPAFKAEPDAAGTDAEFYKLIGIDPATLEPFKNVEGELDASDLAINRAYKIDKANQNQAPDNVANVEVTAPYDSSAEPGFENWTPPVDFSTDQEPGFETWNPPVSPEEDVPEIVVTAPRPEPEGEPGWDNWSAPIVTPPAITTPVTPTPVVPPTVKPPIVKPPTTTPPETTVPEVKKLIAAAAAAGYMPGVGDVAHVKWDNGLFGILPWEETPAPSAEENNDNDPVAALQESQDYANGGHVDDFSVEALLNILRS